MDKFQCLFGIKSEDVREICILMPVLMKGMLKGFGIPQLQRGRLYSCGHISHSTLIKTGFGAGNAGDAILYLRETKCKKAILFGTCGLVEARAGLSLGSLVAPRDCLGAESFSEMLYQDNLVKKRYVPDNGLFEDFLKQGVRSVRCLTVASLKLEEERFEQIKKTRVDVVDMECSAFFSAASFAGIKGAALFYIADIIEHKPFYRSIPFSEKILMESQQRKAIDLLCGLV